MDRSSPIGFLKRYTTFGGETDFFSTILLPVGGIAVTLAALRIATLESKFSRSNIIGLSFLGILVGMVLLLYLLRDAGKFTVDESFHAWKGILKSVGTHLLISSVAVLSLYLVLATAIVGVPLVIPAPFEILFGFSIATIAGVPIAAASRRDLGQKYPRLSEIEDAFDEETELSIENVDNEIRVLGHIERSETARIINIVNDGENAMLLGDGGVGKSGILKKVANSVNHQVLFIDTTRYPEIQSQSELGDKLGIQGDLERAIRQLSIEQTLVVIVDQLDDIGGTEGQVFKDFIVSTAPLKDVSVVFACRDHDLQTRSEYERLRNPDGFSTESEVKRLNRPEVADYIERLIGETPTDELINVGRNIQYLDVIADLADDDVNLNDISGKAALWDKYRESLEHEDQPGDDERRGGRVVQRAVEYAKEATEAGTNLFSVSTDKQWEDSQLINTGVIVAAGDEPGNRRHRFRHPDFQTYLYAWDAVEEGEQIKDVTERLDDRLGKDIFRWMLALYIRSDTALTDQLPDLRDVPDAAENTREFLEELLDEDEGLGYYATTVILDEIKTWDASANSELAEIVLDNLETREELYCYFLDEDTDPSWVYVLQDRGAFNEPSNTLIGFLRDLASEHPETVGDTLDSISVSERRSQALVIAVLRDLPATDATDHVELVHSLLEETEQGHDQRSFEAVQLMEELIKRGHIEAGLNLLDTLLQPQEPEGGTQPESKADLHSLGSTLEDTLESLVNEAPEESVDLFESHLRTAIEMEAAMKNRDEDTIVGFYHSPISTAEFDEPGYTHLRGLLTGTLREVLVQWLDEESPETREEVIQAYLEDITFFRRLGFDLLNQYQESCSDLLRRELFDEDNYTAVWTQTDFLKLLQESFESLSDSEQERITDIILSVPPRESLEERADERSERVDDVTAAELRERYVDQWVRERLWLIRDQLPDRRASRLAELQEQYEGEPRDLVSDSQVKSGFVSEESPKPDDELEAMSPDEFLEFLMRWEPDEEDQSWEEMESGGLREVNQRGLAEAASRVILANPTRYEDQIPQLGDADAVYTATVLDNIREELDDAPQAFCQDFNWPPVFELCEEVASNPGDWESSARLSAARLMKKSFSSEAHESFLSYAGSTKKILFELLDDPDPSPSRDRPPEGHAGHQNPMHVALNAVRPVALDSLIIYAIRAAEHREYQGYSEEESGLEQDVRTHLSSKLDDESLSVRAIFGRRLHYLWYLDHDFVLENLNTLFPRNQSTRDINRFSAAWDAYVSSNILHEDLFSRLRPCYFHAIDLHTGDENTEIGNAQEGLAHHVLSAYLFDFEELEGEDSLVTYLYDRDDPELARQMAWRLWRSGKDEEDIRQKWVKVKTLWRVRLEQVDDVEAYSDEIQWFIEWLPMVEDQAELAEAEPLLVDSLSFIAHTRRSWQTLETYLLDRTSEHPETVIRIYDKLMQQGTRPISVRFSEETAGILQPGVNADPETRRITLDIAEAFAEDGDESARAFLDRHT
jgi:hypothetical protein